MKIQKRLHYIVSLDKISNDMHNDGFSELCIQNTLQHWKKYEGREVKKIDSDNGLIIGTQLPIHIAWCVHESSL